MCDIQELLLADQRDRDSVEIMYIDQVAPSYNGQNSDGRRKHQSDLDVQAAFTQQVASRSVSQVEVFCLKNSAHFWVAS